MSDETYLREVIEADEEHTAELEQRIRQLEAERDALRAALKPFAVLGPVFKHRGYHANIVVEKHAGWPLAAGDFFVAWNLVGEEMEAAAQRLDGEV